MLHVLIALIGSTQNLKMHVSRWVAFVRSVLFSPAVVRISENMIAIPELLHDVTWKACVLNVFAFIPASINAMTAHQQLHKIRACNAHHKHTGDFVSNCTTNIYMWSRSLHKNQTVQLRRKMQSYTCMWMNTHTCTTSLYNDHACSEQSMYIFQCVLHIYWLYRSNVRL